MKARIAILESEQFSTKNSVKLFKILFNKTIQLHGKAE